MKSPKPKATKRTAKKAAKKTAKPADSAPPEKNQKTAPITAPQPESPGQKQANQKIKKGGPAKKKKDKKPALMDMSVEGNLAVEAHHLRVVLREISSRFISDLESAIVRTVEMISEVPDRDKKQAELRLILKQMQSLRLKPQKGRLADLRRIRNMVERVNSRLEEII